MFSRSISQTSNQPHLSPPELGPEHASTSASSCAPDTALRLISVICQLRWVLLWLCGGRADSSFRGGAETDYPEVSHPQRTDVSRPRMQAVSTTARRGSRENPLSINGRARPFTSHPSLPALCRPFKTSTFHQRILGTHPRQLLPHRCCEMELLTVATSILATIPDPQQLPGATKPKTARMLPERAHASLP